MSRWEKALSRVDCDLWVQRPQLKEAAQTRPHSTYMHLSPQSSEKALLF